MAIGNMFHHLDMDWDHRDVQIYPDCMFHLRVNMSILIKTYKVKILLQIKKITLKPIINVWKLSAVLTSPSRQAFTFEFDVINLEACTTILTWQ